MVDDVQKLLEYMTDMLGNDSDNRSVTFSLKNIVEIEDINRKIERLLRELEIEGMIEQYELKEEYEVSVKLSKKSLLGLKDKNGNVSKHVIGNEIELKKTVAVDVVKQEVYIENIRRKKLKELLVGESIAILITTIGYWNKNLGINRAFLILLGVFVGLVVILSYLEGCESISKLKQIGGFGEIRSYIGILLNFLELLVNKEERSLGNTYKNIDGKIYLIKYKECPFCETEPIGKMYLKKNITANQDFWQCSLHLKHQKDFDYKKKI